MKPDQFTKARQRAAKAADVRDLQEAVGWELVLEPALRNTRELYQKELTHKLLGLPPLRGDTKDASPEQIAGRIHGIEFVYNLFDRILREGQSSQELLAEQMQFHTE